MGEDEVSEGLEAFADVPGTGCPLRGADRRLREKRDSAFAYIVPRGHLMDARCSSVTFGMHRCMEVVLGRFLG